MGKLVGRDEELAAIAELLEAHDLPQAAVLHGEAGIGKTSLWLAGIDAARVSGFRVLSARPSEAETGLGFSGLSDLLATAIDAVLPELPPIQRRALEAGHEVGDHQVRVGDPLQIELGPGILLSQRHPEVVREAA